MNDRKQTAFTRMVNVAEAMVGVLPAKAQGLKLLRSSSKTFVGRFSDVNKLIELDEMGDKRHFIVFNEDNGNPMLLMVSNKMLIELMSNPDYFQSHFEISLDAVYFNDEKYPVIKDYSNLDEEQAMMESAQNATESDYAIAQ